MKEDKREILDKLDELQEHFYNYLFTKTIRDISLTINLKEKDWDFIKQQEGQKSLLLGRRSFTVEEIYMLMIPFVSFIKKSREEVIPDIELISKNNLVRLNLSPQEKSIRKILVENYKNNINTLGQIILDLYELIVVEDLKENIETPPLCLTIKEIKNIEEDLNFIEESQNS